MTVTGGEKEEEPPREAVSEAGAEEDREEPSTTDSPIVSSEEEGSDRDVNMNESIEQKNDKDGVKLSKTRVKNQSQSHTNT